LGLSGLPDPRPQRYFTDTPGIGGSLKVRPEDFVVEEIPIYEPSGSGEHLYLGIQKQGVSHGELLAVLADRFRVRESAIGYAGMKDKHAVTRQVVSIHLPRGLPAGDGELRLDHDRIAILWADRHLNKIRRGHLVGNRFSIRIRDVEPLRAPAAHASLREIAARGMPTWYGPQRFGYRLNNHLLGSMLVRRQWNAIVDELLTTRGSPYPAHQEERRRLGDEARWAEAHELWTVADRSERIVCGRLARGATPEQAIRRIGPVTLNFWTSALSSAAFNRMLDERVACGLVDQLVDGDLAWKHDSRAVFAVDGRLLASGELGPRLSAFEISPSGPLWGSRMTEAAGEVAKLERQALRELEVESAQLDAAEFAPDGRRRPYREQVSNVDVEGGFDEHGPYVRCVFDLPRGMYATVVLREIMKNADADHGGGPGAGWLLEESMAGDGHGG